MCIRHDVILKVRVNFRENFLPIFICFKKIHEDHCIKLVRTQWSLESYRRRISTIETITRKQQSKLSKRCWKIRISSISNRTHHITIVEVFFTLSNANSHSLTYIHIHTHESCLNETLLLSLSMALKEAENRKQKITN